MAALPTDEQIAVLREQGFVVARGFADAGRVAALRALSERHLQDHVAPIEYEADLRYPGAPESRQAEGGQTVRRLLSAVVTRCTRNGPRTRPSASGWRAISARRRCCPPCTTTAS